MKFPKLLKYICIVSLLQGLWACNNYKLKYNYIKNCGDDEQVIKAFENSTVELTKNCDYIANTCVTLKKYTKAIAYFTVSKANITVFKGTHNICQKNKKTSEVISTIMLFLGIPPNCPMDTGIFCQNNFKHTIPPSAARILGLALGDVLVEAKIEHNNGKSCILNDVVYFK